ncbi:MAG: tail fiber domain-containing protein, partial [Bacteroidales bacterium]|nr:tail fiber domain-containing protein [Bacteroidales bacterium]
TGDHNIALGYKAGENISTGSNNIIIGYDIDAPDAIADNQMSIGNLIFATGIDGTGTTISSGNVGIGVSSPQELLHVEGSIRMVDGNEAAGKIMTSDANGTASWTEPPSADDNDWEMDGADMYSEVSGNVGIGTVTPGATLDVGGHIWQTGTGSSVFIGEGAGSDDDLSDNQNVFVGYDAGKTNTIGNNNTANGYQSLYSNTTANHNIAIGSNALYTQSFDMYGFGTWNIAIGDSALFLNQPATIYDGILKIAIGHCSLRSNTTGYENTAIGHKSLYKNTTGFENTASGIYSLYYNTSGHENTASGNHSLFSNTSGNGNAANGSYSLKKNTTGSYNTASGILSLHSNTTGNYNTASGESSLYANTTGNYNTASGSMSLFRNITANHNIAIGSKALYTQSYNNSGNSWNSWNIAIGDSALYLNQPTDTLEGIFNTAVGHISLHSNTTGNYNTANGCLTLSSNTTGGYNTALGYSASSNDIYYSNSTGLGYNAQPGGTNRIMLGNSSVYWIGGYSAWHNISDARMKTNIKEDVKGLDFIMELRPVTYYLDKDKIDNLTGTVDLSDYPEKYDVEKIRQSGFLAQEVEQAAQKTGYDFNGVSKPMGDKGYYSLAYAEFVVPLVKGMQEQQEVIEKLEKENSALKEQMEALIQRMEKLEK